MGGLTLENAEQYEKLGSNQTYGETLANVLELAEPAKAHARQAYALMTDPKARQQFATNLSRPLNQQDVDRAIGVFSNFGPSNLTLAGAPLIMGMTAQRAKTFPVSTFRSFYGFEHPAFEKIANDVEQKFGKEISETDFVKTFGEHPEYKTALARQEIDGLKGMGKQGPANLYEELNNKGYKVAVSNSKSLGSISTYFVVKHPESGEKVTIRLSNHPPQPQHGGYERHDIYTTPQHWKSAMKKAEQMLETKEE